MGAIIAALAAAGLLVSAAPSQAAGSTGPRWNAHFGVKPIHVPAGATGSPASNTLFLHSSAKKGAVSPRPSVYLVFWGSQWSNDPAGAAAALQAFFQGLYGAADTWGTILTQYCEGLPVGTTTCGTDGRHVRHPRHGPLAGVWFDNEAAAPTQATVPQISAEAAVAAEHFGNTTQRSNLNAQYVIASPTGTHPDGFGIGGGFCAWHDYTPSVLGNLAYTNLPYVPDLGAGACTTIANPKTLDGYFSTETHEYAETVTDFWPIRGWLGGGGEIADECVQLDTYLTLSTGTFDVQGLWSNDLNRCTTQD